MRPTYDELPQLPGSDLRHAWEVFGAGDALGTLNGLTPETRRRAGALVSEGVTVNLSLPLDRPDPPPFGRRHPVHHVYATSSFSWDDRVDDLHMQGSTQWDGLLHVRHKKFGFYGGRLTDPVPHDPLGIDRWVEHGMVGRGVLLDVGRHLAALDSSYDPLETRAVTPEDLREVADAQGVELLPGDILCIRFGWVEAFSAADEATRARLGHEPCWAGLSARADTARHLWDLGIAAIACDNPSVEVQPGHRDDGYLHHRLLTMLGMPLGELFAFDELAARCAARGSWDFLFASAPLNLPGAVGSPANAVALL
jgi:kynurenine formamidase